jgi:hypothetical protein
VELDLDFGVASGKAEVPSASGDGHESSKVAG